MKRAVLYARHSPRPGPCDSSERQIDRLRQHCEIHDYEVLDVFSDEMRSGGTGRRRPELEKALACACANRAVFMVTAMDRFARSLMDALKMITKLHRAKADFVSITEQMDTTTPVGMMLFQICSALAEFQRRLIAERTRVMMLSHQFNGRKMSCVAPFGQRVVSASVAGATDGKDRLQPEPDEQRMILEIVRFRGDFIRGRRRSFRSIAREMNASGSRARGFLFAHKLVRSILRRFEASEAMQERTTQ